MRHRLTTLLAVGVAVALAGLVAASAAPAAIVVPEPAIQAPDGSYCYDASVDCGTGSGTAWAVQESPFMYAYTGDAYAGRCKTVWARAERKNLFGLTVFRYYEQVRWCWNGSAVTYFRRDRWGADTNYGWRFDGHIAGNCQIESCPGKTGHYAETAWTQGKFHACVVWACMERLPIVSITVYANGSFSWSWSGA